jgi:hypothetical protein
MSLRKVATPKASMTAKTPKKTSAKAPAKAAAKASMPAAAKAVSEKAASDKATAGQSATVRIIPAPAQADPASMAGDKIASAEATQLAARIERDLKDGRLDTLTQPAFQALMAALCRSYGAQLEAGTNFLPVVDRGGVTPTDTMTIASGLLKAANLAVFELGMWQSWTGR